MSLVGINGDGFVHDGEFDFIGINETKLVVLGETGVAS